MARAAGIGADACEQLIGALVADNLDALNLWLPQADRALLSYAAKLTRTPGAMTAADVESLRQSGFDDRAIHDACAVVGYFAFVNRIADGLGVELEIG